VLSEYAEPDLDLLPEVALELAVDHLVVCTQVDARAPVLHEFTREDVHAALLQLLYETLPTQVLLVAGFLEGHFEYYPVGLEGLGQVGFILDLLPEFLDLHRNVCPEVQDEPVHVGCYG